MAERRKAAASKKTARKSVSKPAKKMATKKTARTTAKKAVKKTAKKASAKAPAKRKTSAKKARAKKASKTGARRWSQNVTEHSDALDLKSGVFTLKDPKKIAASLKQSAEHSARRKTGAYRSALSMLTFYINRAGKTLPKAQAARLVAPRTS